MFKFIKKNIKNIILFIIVFVISFIKYAYLKNYNNDVFLTYGWSYSIANGLIPYLDFNSVLFPFASLFYAFIMKILSCKLIVYYVITSAIIATIILLVKRINKSSTLIVLLLFSYMTISNYNLLCIFLFLILVILEKEYKNSYLIGIILGLLVLTNQKMAVLLIPAVMKRNLKENIKMIKPFIITIELLLIYLCVNNAFNNFMNYTVFGLFDFGSDNFRNMIYYVAIELIIIFSLFATYIKTRDIYALYFLFFQIIALPIVDLWHTVIGVIIYIIYWFRLNNKIINFIIGYTCLVCIFTFYYNYINSLRPDSYVVTDCTSNFYMTTMYSDFNAQIEKIYDYYYDNSDENDIYFIWNSSYYAKLYMNVEINRFDLFLLGNNGYNGNENLKKAIRSIDEALFIVNIVEQTDDVFEQTNFEIINFITENYEMVEQLDYNFYVYKVIN